MPAFGRTAQARLEAAARRIRFEIPEAMGGTSV